jgi:C4-dicarboxylate transporter DctQ subunit
MVESLLWFGLIGMIAVVFINIVLRAAFMESLYWAEEVARYIMIWISLLGAAVGFRRGAHIGLVFFLERLPRMISIWIVILTKLLTLVFLIVLLEEGIKLALMAKSQSWGSVAFLSMLWVYSSVPISSFFMLIGLVNTLFRDLDKIGSSKG